MRRENGLGQRPEEGQQQTGKQSGNWNASNTWARKKSIVKPDARTEPLCLQNFSSTLWAPKPVLERVWYLTKKSQWLMGNLNMSYIPSAFWLRRSASQIHPRESAFFFFFTNISLTSPPYPCLCPPTQRSQTWLKWILLNVSLNFRLKFTPANCY